MEEVRELSIGNNVYDIESKSVVDQNTGKLKFWSGTKAEYDALKGHPTYYAWETQFPALEQYYNVMYTLVPSKNMNDPIDVYVLDNGVMRRFTEGNAIFIQYPGETESFISFDIQGCTEHFRTESKDIPAVGTTYYAWKTIDDTLPYPLLYTKVTSTESTWDMVDAYQYINGEMVLFPEQGRILPDSVFKDDLVFNELTVDHFREPSLDVSISLIDNNTLYCVEGGGLYKGEKGLLPTYNGELE